MPAKQLRNLSKHNVVGRINGKIVRLLGDQWVPERRRLNPNSASFLATDQIIKASAKKLFLNSGKRSLGTKKQAKNRKRIQQRKRAGTYKGFPSVNAERRRRNQFRNSLEN